MAESGADTAFIEPCSAGSADRIAIFGYGSLLSVWSCRRTCPSVSNHRLAVLPGWQRVFSLVSASQLRNGNADQVLRQLAAVAVAPTFQLESPPFTVGALFSINPDDFAALRKREHRYEMKKLDCYEADDVKRERPIPAFVVVESTDENYFRKCNSEQAEGEAEGSKYHELIGQFYGGSLWGRRDIFPVTKYLRFCVAAAHVLGGSAAQSNFLDASFLADRRTSIRTYLQRGSPGLVIPGCPMVRILPDLAVHHSHDEAEDGGASPQNDLGRASSCRVAVLRPYIRIVATAPRSCIDGFVKTTAQALQTVQSMVKAGSCGHVADGGGGCCYSFGAAIDLDSEEGEGEGAIIGKLTETVARTWPWLCVLVEDDSGGLEEAPETPPVGSLGSKHAQAQESSGGSSS